MSDCLERKINVATKLVGLYAAFIRYNWVENDIKEMRENIRDLKRNLDYLTLFLDEFEKEVMKYEKYID